MFGYKNEGALQDILVLDFTQALSGPFCTMQLADLGANVIKVEAKGGDAVRWNGVSEGRSGSPYENTTFDLENANKRGVVLNLNLYTDRVVMPNGDIQTWRRCAISRLYLAGQPWLLYLQIALAAVSVVAAVLMLFGVSSRIVKIVRFVSTVASAVMFIILMIVTGNANVRYA